MTWHPKEETARAALIRTLALILIRAACATAFVALSFSASASSQQQLNFTMLYPVTDTRYAIGYVGGTSTPAASIKTLTAAGPLLLSKEHRLATGCQRLSMVSHTRLRWPQHRPGSIR